MAIHSEASQDLPQAGPIGRTVRIVMGTTLAFFLVNVVRQFSAAPHGFFAARPGWSFPGGDWWLVALVCLWALPRMIDDGFGTTRGEWVRAIYVLLAGGAIAWDRAVHGSLWAAPLAWLVLLLVLYILAHAGISFLVAGVAATPG